MKKLLSLCMIVKNEENTIGRCLDSVFNLVDEIVIVDTGSTDRTKEIVRKYTDKIYDFEWMNDFAAARNESLDHASGEWILVLDADEYVEPGQTPALRQMLETIRPDGPQGFLIRVMNFLGSDGNQVMESPGARLFTNHPDVYYSEPIHEQLRSKSGSIPFTPISFTVYHTGYTDQTVKEKNKSERNMNILNRMGDAGRREDPYYCFVLGNEYKNAGKEEEALRLYLKSFRKSKKTDAWYVHLSDRLVQTQLKTQNFRDAYQTVLHGKSLWPNHADYYCLEGILFEQFGYYERAVRNFEFCLALASRCERENRPYWLTQINYGRSIPHRMLAEIARKQGDLNRFVYHLTSALQSDPNDRLLLKMLLQMLALHDAADNTISFIEKLYPINEDSHIVLLLRASFAIGNPQIAIRYWRLCEEKKIRLTLADQLSYALLFRKPVEPEPDMTRIAPDLALAYAVISDDPDMINHTNNEYTLSLNHLYDKIVSLLKGETVTLEVSDEESPCMLNGLSKLYLYQYDEIFNVLLSKISNADFLHRLADAMLLSGRTEVSIEIYSHLLERGLLKGQGCKQFGQLCCLYGNVEEGLELVEQALQSEPSYDLAGIYTGFCSNELKMKAFLKTYKKTYDPKEIPAFVI